MGKDSSNKTPKTQETKANLGKEDYIKLKCFWKIKQTINRVREQLAERKKIFANYPPDKGLKSGK